MDEETRAQIQAQIDALDAAMGTGAVEVQQGNERVRYRGSMQDMRIARASLVERLNGGTTRRPTHFQPAFDRGR